MPRDIPVGNGQVLATFDHEYRLRDLYFPRVGQENHVGGTPCRFGVYGDLIKPDPRFEDGEERRKKRLYWSDDGWDKELKYVTDTLASDVTMRHEALQIELKCSDVVDFNRPLLVRRIDINNLHDSSRRVGVLHHQDIALYGTRIGDTAYYDPQLRSLIHYRKQRYVMACFYAHGEQRIDEYATGTAGWGGAEGTYRDAEDGKLGCNPIAQGAVDSTMLINVDLPANGSATVYLVIGCGTQYEDLEVLHNFVHRESPQGVLDRTKAYWRLWLAANRAEFPPESDCGLSEKIKELFNRSLLVVRTQIDNGGAVIAANDSDIMQFNRDTYSYMWPRDGALVVDAMDSAGFPHVSRSFFNFCCDALEQGGYLQHKYNPEGSPGSSWHPWIANGQPQLPIQEDETALVVWALWRHFVRYRDIEIVRPMWASFIQPATDFLARFRDPVTKLPLPSYDLWEERWGVHAFTVATVHAGLCAGWQFAVCFGDTKRAARYAHAAEEVKDAFEKYMWSDKLGRFLRRITPTDHDRTNRFMADVLAGRAPAASVDPLVGPGDMGEDPKVSDEVIEMEEDEIIDASMYAIFAMGLLPVNDERVVKTMQAIEDELWIKTEVGGIARYTNDYYHQVNHDVAKVPGNPWYICTLWMAQWHIARAKSPEELKAASKYFDWSADHAEVSGVLAEQVHPDNGDPLSVSPLTWSHATIVATVMQYLNRYEELSLHSKAGEPLSESAMQSLRDMEIPRLRPSQHPIPEMG